MTADHIVILSGPLKGRAFLIKDALTIGRNPDNSIALNSPQVSRKHAQILRRPVGVVILDLSSGNGTYVGHERITEHVLKDGDVVRIGNIQIQFRSGNAPAVSDASSGSFMMNDNDPSHYASEKMDKVYQTFFQLPATGGSDADLRKIQKRLQAIYAANQAIAGEQSLEKLFDCVMEQVFSLISAHNGLILLKKDGTHELNVEYVRSASPDAQIQVSSTIIKRAFEHGEAIITSNAPRDARFGAMASIIAENITSAMCVPLTHQQDRLGVVYVDNHGATNAFSNSDLEMLVALSGPAATAIKNAQFVKMLEQAYQDTLMALANAIELRDHYTVGHTWRVTNFAVEIARELGWDERKLKEVQMGGVLHDVGKIAVDNAILGKQGPLTEEEFAQIRVHPERGADLLRDIAFLQPLIPYCLYHHEKWDGTGYPFGLKGTDIPVEGRLIAVADAFDAMTSTRPYRAGMDPKVALEALNRSRGIQFDAEITDALQRCYDQGRIDRILQDYFKSEARSLACPFCSTFIRFGDAVDVGAVIPCTVCHRQVRIERTDGTYYGVLESRSTGDTPAHPA